MNNNFQSIFSKSNEVIKLVEGFLDDLKDLNLGNREKLMLEICSIGLLTKSFRLFKAIQLLCKEELSNEAHALLRVLAETALTLFVIYKEESERITRAKNLLAYERVVKMKFVKAYHQNPNLGDIPENIINKLSKQVDEIKNEYGDETYDEMRKNKGVWKGMLRLEKKEGVKEVMDYVGFNNMYDSIYRIGSKNIHADDFLEYIKVTNEGPMLMEKDPNGIEGHLIVSAFFILDIMGVLSDYVKNGPFLESNIIRLKQEIQSEYDKLNSQFRKA